MLNFNTALTALRASQVGLNTVANNIANAGTAGYHRQSARFADRPPHEQYNLLIGTGVDVQHIMRMRHEITENAITSNISAGADLQSKLDALRRIESLLLPSDGSLNDRVQTFMDSLSQLSANASDSTSRTAVVDNATALASAINSLADNLQQLKHDLDVRIRETVNEINERLPALADINQQIRVAKARGLAPNDLLDRRDQLVNELAQLVDARAVEQSEGQSIVMLAQDSVLVGVDPAALEFAIDENGEAVISLEGFEDPVFPGGGELAGLLSARNEIVGEYESLLGSFTNGLIAGVDGVHAAGIGTLGSFEFVQGVRAVSDVTVPLADSIEGLPISAGELVIAVTDLATGQRTLSTIAIDPATDSLQDVAAAISTVDNLQATVDSQTGKLTMLATPGYQFDFAGGLETAVELAGVSGSTVPVVHGTYAGTGNEQYQFDVVGTGTIGVTPGLTLEVRDGVGTLIATLDVGEQYEPDSLLEIADGFSISLTSGTAANGDTFSVAAIGQSDSAGILTALGLNSLFSGSTPGDLQVNPLVLQDPGRLATGKGGLSGDTGNLAALIALRDERLLGGGTATLEQFLGEMIAGVGFHVQDLDAMAFNLSVLGESLDAERTNISGVDPNEELVLMLEFQRSFQAASRIVSTVDQMLDDLMRIIR